MSGPRIKIQILLNHESNNRNRAFDALNNWQCISTIHRCKSLCRETNACGLILETEKSNVPGNSLYPKAGFTLDEEHNHYSWSV